MILLLETIHADALAHLKDADEVSVVDDLVAFDPGAARPGVRAIVTRGRGVVSADLLAAAPDLAVVARCGAGLDNVDTEAAAEAGVTVIHAPGVTTGAVAEHALLLMLAAARRLVELDGAVKGGNWGIREGYEGAELRGRRLGIIGFGSIGRRVAELGGALGMDVVCTTRSRVGAGNVPPGGVPPDNVATDNAATDNAATCDVAPVDLAELLTTADVIQLCVPLTDQTRGMIGADELASMKPSAVLVNTARAGVVNHDALARSIVEEEIGAYACDVWAPEPPTADDPLLRHPRVLVTPHVAGLTDVTYRKLCLGPAGAVVDVLQGRTPDPAFVFTGS